MYWIIIERTEWLTVHHDTDHLQYGLETADARHTKWGWFTFCPWSWPPLQVQAHAAWLKALVQCLRRLLGGTCGAKNVYSDDVFTITSLCIIVIIWREISVESSWKYRQLNPSYQIRKVVPVTILTIPHHTNRTVLKKSTLKWRLKHVTKGRIASFQYKHRNQWTCYVEKNCFHLVKIDNHNNKSDVNVKTS
jgi:hypothetical protein